MYLSLSLYICIYIHIPGISCCTFGPQAANYECLYAALMVPILRSWAIYCFCLATGSLPPILGAPLCYPRPVTEQHPHCFRWQPRPRFTDYIELYNLFKYIIIIVYMSICFVCVYIYMTYIQIAYMPCWWIESAQVLYILSVLTNYSHEFAQEVLQQERPFAAQKILIDTLESAGFHFILFMPVQHISHHIPS